MTKYHYCLLLMGSLLLGSCQSVEQLSIDYMLPAEVSFPATLKRVAVVNNMPNVPDNKLIITEEEQKKSENEVARLTNYYNGDAATSYHNHLIINTTKCATFSIRLSPIQYTIEWHSVYD